MSFDTAKVKQSAWNQAGKMEPKFYGKAVKVSKSKSRVDDTQVALELQRHGSHLVSACFCDVDVHG